MKKTIGVVTAAIFCLSIARASDMEVQAVMAKDEKSPPATSFTADVPKIYCIFRTTGSHKGDKLRSVWVAEDIGDLAPHDTKIDEATVTADRDDFFGSFSLSKPSKGWPLGRYRVEFHDNDEVEWISTVTFKITAPK